MAAIGPVEVLVFRGRVPLLALVPILVVLSPVAAGSLLFIVGPVAGALTSS